MPAATACEPLAALGAGAGLDEDAGDEAGIEARGIERGEVAIDEPEATFATLRPLGTEAVKVLFAREMERELRKRLESGGLKALRGRKRRR